MTLGLLSLTYITYSNQHSKHFQTYFKNKNIEAKVPLIIEAGWGCVLVKFKEDFTEKSAYGTKRADTIFLSTKHVDWNWKDPKFKTSHNPGYSKETIENLIKMYPKSTHLMLTTGYDDVLRVFGEVRTDDNIKGLEVKVKSCISNKNVQIIILNTKEAIMRYNELCQDPKNKVVMPAHFTC